jgi:phospholipid/cholesterol/gamma-HCH transport system ATP-binding protein
MSVEEIISVKSLSTFLGGNWIHRDVNFSIKKGEIIAIVGGSGCGKSTLLRELLCLLKPTSGEIKIFKQNILSLNGKDLRAIQTRCGVLFQQSALFSSLTVLENIIFPLTQLTHLNPDTMVEIALLKLALVGLMPDAAHKYPAELSGGMQKRAALARALALDPELLFLDEPSSGLDPASSASQDKLLLDLQHSLGLTIVLVTHDLNTLESIVDGIIFLGEKKVLAIGSYQALRDNPHPEIHAFFHHLRIKAAEES